MQKINRAEAGTRQIIGWAGTGAAMVFLLAGCATPPEQQSAQTPGSTPGTTADDTTANTAMNSTANSTETDATATGMATADSTTKAVAVLHPTKGNNVRGTVTFTKEAGGVRIVANLTGLTPGAHGFHAHQTGDCSAPDASSAGGHFNPTDMPHSAPDSDQRHAGDFGNLTADASGKATYNKLDTKVELDGPNSIVGRAIIVHAKADDLKTQPTGDAGGRQACGVVGIGS